jgi:hypothetical protein
LAPCHPNEIDSLGEQGPVIAALIRRFQEVNQNGNDSLSRRKAGSRRKEFLVPIYELGQDCSIAFQAVKQNFSDAPAITSFEMT